MHIKRQPGSDYSNIAKTLKGSVTTSSACRDCSVIVYRGCDLQGHPR